MSIRTSKVEIAEKIRTSRLGGKICVLAKKVYFIGILGAKKFQVFENGSKLILPNKLGI